MTGRKNSLLMFPILITRTVSNSALTAQYAYCFIASIILLFANGVAAQTTHPGANQPLPQIDVSQSSDSTLLSASNLESSAQRSAAAALIETIPGLVIEYNALTSTPSRMVSTQSFMTPRQAVSTEPSVVIRNFVRQNAAVFGLSAADLNTIAKTREVEGENSPTLEEQSLNASRKIAFEQRWQGRQIFPTNLVGIVASQGQLASLAGITIQDVGGKIKALEPVLTPADAIVIAAENIGGDIELEMLEALGPPTGSENRQSFSGGQAFNAVVPVRLIYFLASANDVRLVWEVVAGLKNDPFAYQLLLDAETGEILFRESITSHDVPRYLSYTNVLTTPTADARNDYQPQDNPEPLTPGPDTPDGSQGVAVTPQVLVTNGDPAASVGGWTEDGEMRTTGNNVIAFVDLNDNSSAESNEQPTASLVDIGGVQTREFDFPADFTQAPEAQANRDAASVNTFVMANWWHDRMAQLGFTEAAGKFQTTNSTGSGVSGDPIRARLHVGTDNSTFGTPPSDGTCCPTLNSFHVDRT